MEIAYISAHVLLNLLNELGNKISCEAVPSILRFPNECNKFYIFKNRSTNVRFYLSYDTKIAFYYM